METTKLYCFECGRELQQGYLIRSVDGELEIPGFLPCPEHPHGKVTEIRKEVVVRKDKSLSPTR